MPFCPSPKRTNNSKCTEVSHWSVRWLTRSKLASYQYGVFGAQKSHISNNTGPVFRRCKINSFNSMHFDPSWSAVDENEMQKPNSSRALAEKSLRGKINHCGMSLAASASTSRRPVFFSLSLWQADVGLWVWSSFGPIQLRTLRPRGSTEKDMPCTGRSHMARVYSKPRLSMSVQLGRQASHWWLLPPLPV